MHRKIRFRQNERVNAISLTGKKVIGVYRGVRPSYGVYVYGLEIGGSTEQALHVCAALTLKRVETNINKKGNLNHRPKAGDPYKGRTKEGDLITGFFMNSAAKYVWLSGWKEGTDRLQPKQAYKVLTNTLEKA